MSRDSLIHPELIDRNAPRPIFKRRTNQYCSYEIHVCMFCLFNCPIRKMSNNHLAVEKKYISDDGLQDLGLPVAVQTFLWGQIAPFIRPKLGKLHEAACMVSKIQSSFIHIILHYTLTT